METVYVKDLKTDKILEVTKSGYNNHMKGDYFHKDNKKVLRYELTTEEEYLKYTGAQPKNQEAGDLDLNTEGKVPGAPAEHVDTGNTANNAGDAGAGDAGAGAGDAGPGAGSDGPTAGNGSDNPNGDH